MEKQLKEISTENDRLKRLLADKELELAILRELRDIQKTSVADRVAIAKRWIDKGYKASVVLGSVGLASSTYYNKIKETKTTVNQGLPQKKPGRKISKYSLNLEGEQIPDELIKQYIKEIVAIDGFPYGYKKINATLKEDYRLIINHKKTYRLCKELNVLRPREQYIQTTRESRQSERK